VLLTRDAPRAFFVPLERETESAIARTVTRYPRVTLRSGPERVPSRSALGAPPGEGPSPPGAFGTMPPKDWAIVGGSRKRRTETERTPVKRRRGVDPLD